MIQANPSAHAATIDVPLRVRPDFVSVQAEPHSQLERLITLLVKVWWRFEALLERWKMGMKEHRIDPDYDPTENDVRTLRRAIEQLLLAGPGGNNYNNGGSDKRTLNWILGMVGALVVSAIVGGIAFYGKFTALEERVSGMMSAYEVRIRRLEDINERRYRESQ